MHRKCIGIEVKCGFLHVYKKKSVGFAQLCIFAEFKMKISGISMIQVSTGYSSAFLNALTGAIANGFRSHSRALLL